MPRLLPGWFVLLKWLSLQSQRTGFYIIDAKPLALCHNRRIAANRVFADWAARGKCSMGWLVDQIRSTGWKLHLLINQYGQMVSFLLTPANVADNNALVLNGLLDRLQGQCYGDRRYLTKIFAHFYQRGLEIITKIGRKMKNTLMRLGDKLKLRKRGLIERPVQIGTGRGAHSSSPSSQCSDQCFSQLGCLLFL